LWEVVRVRTTLALAAIAAVSLAACGGSGSETTSITDTARTESVRPASPEPRDDNDAELRAAVQAYSDGFLTGQPVEAYELFSARCKERLSLSYFTGLVIAAKGAYGSALPIQSFDAEISGDLARVTYTYDVSALDQTAEPWSFEDGQWRQDDCPAG
jgi:hypothetical protein